MRLVLLVATLFARLNGLPIDRDCTTIIAAWRQVKILMSDLLDAIRPKIVPSHAILRAALDH